jgi:hypothetical protein
MALSFAFRLSVTAFVALTLLVLTPGAGRCAGQETGRQVDASRVVQAFDDAQRAAGRRARARVIIAEVRAALLVLRDPDEAYQLLKTALDAIRNDPELSVSYREHLESHLFQALVGVFEIGSSIKRLQNESLAVKEDFRQLVELWREQLECWKSQLGLLLGRG